MKYVPWASIGLDTETSLEAPVAPNILSPKEYNNKNQDEIDVDWWFFKIIALL